jgi:hypothetical protein
MIGPFHVEFTSFGIGRWRVRLEDGEKEAREIGLAEKRTIRFPTPV